MDYRHTIKAVTDWYNIPFREIYDHNRKKTITEARFLAIMLVRELHGTSFTELSDIFNRDPAAIRNAIDSGFSKEHLVKVFNYFREQLRLEYARGTYGHYLGHGN